MHRRSSTRCRGRGSVPRMRGDAPAAFLRRCSLVIRSPHARGCTGSDEDAPAGHRPFPACAGMHRNRGRRACRPTAVPRMRGDAPSPPASMICQRFPFPACAGMHRMRRAQELWPLPVPRMRGDAPHEFQIEAFCEGPFPACAGMHRRLCSWLPARWSVPRMRGDAPSSSVR